MNFKKGWEKFWYLLWKDNSWKGWIFSIVVLFVFLKLIFFPGLELITGSSLPLAIVESCSMYHDGNLFSDYDEWWDEHDSKYSEYDMTKKEFEDYIFKRGFNKGDILISIKAKPEKLKIGDVIIFKGGGKDIIHRIINIGKENNEYTFATIGDNNNGQLTFETDIKEEQLIGKAVFKIAPYLGWGKLIFYEHLKPNSEKGLCHEN